MRSLLYLYHVVLALNVCLGVLSSPSLAHASTPQHIVCVEDVWCDIARDVGGDTVSTHILISAEGLDPHHIHPTPSMARQLSQADAVLINGATYDDWALPLSSSSHKVFNAVHFAPHWQNGDDPHLFFDLDTVTQVANALSQWLIEKNPSQKDILSARLAHFHSQTENLAQRLSVLHTQFNGQPVAVTEPAGERLLQRAGLTVINHRWALSVMNENGTSPRDTAELEHAISKNHIRFLLVNPAVTSPQVSDLITLANAHSVPIIHAGETLPHGLSWFMWMTTIIDQIDQILTRPTQ